MKLFNGQIFDSVVSLGYNCRCTMYLRDHRLRDCSSPFDWVTGATFGYKVKALCDDFQDFLMYDNLQFVNDERPAGALVEHDRYDDKVNGCIFMHEFPVGVSLSESYAAVSAKYKRRIERLQEKLKSSASVLLVWWGAEQVDDATVVDAVRQVNAHYPGGPKSLLMIEDTNAGEEVSCAEVPGSDGRAWRVRGPFVRGELDMIGNTELCNEIFGAIRLRGALRQKLRWGLGRFLIHALIWYLPTKALRRRVKARLQPIFLGRFF